MERQTFYGEINRKVLFQVQALDVIKAVGEREIARIIYYKPQHKEISEVFWKFWEGEVGGEIKQPLKNADSLLIMDAVTLADKLDVVVILGGDKDYLPLLWYLKSRGCKTELWGYPETVSDIMKVSVDKFSALDESFIIKDKPRGKLSYKARFSEHKHEEGGGG
ncbi:MAG: NYN domain-containing protein [Nitrospinae bacterium]|nr:NYN domain-containing protein [Nitrospinota bacterium]